MRGWDMSRKSVPLVQSGQVAKSVPLSKTADEDGPAMTGLSWAGQRVPDTVGQPVSDSGTGQPPSLEGVSAVPVSRKREKEEESAEGFALLAECSRGGCAIAVASAATCPLAG